MTTEVAVNLVHPLTGELIKPSETRKVADTIEDLRAHRHALQTYIDEFTEALVEHSRQIGAKTFSAGGRTVVVSADKELQWDVTILNELIEAGLPEERFSELVTTEVTYKINAAVAKQIESASDEYATIIQRARSYVPKKQYVSLRPVTEVQR